MNKHIDDINQVIDVSINGTVIRINKKRAQFSASNIKIDHTGNTAIVQTTLVSCPLVDRQTAKIIKTILDMPIIATTEILTNGNYSEVYLGVAKICPSVHHALALYEFARTIGLKLLRVVELVLSDRLTKWLCFNNRTLTKFIPEMFKTCLGKRTALGEDNGEVCVKYYFSRIHLDNTFSREAFDVVEAFIKNKMMIVLDEMTFIEMKPYSYDELKKLTKECPIDDDVLDNLYAQKIKRLRARQ